MKLADRFDPSFSFLRSKCFNTLFLFWLAILSQGEDLTETEKPLKEEETPLKSVEINEQKPSFEDEPLEVIEMNAKQNDINEGFRRFFSNIGLKLTVKRGSSEKATDAPDKTNKEEPNIPEDVNDTKSNNAELNTDVNIAQKSCDNDSTTCPTMTDVTSEDVADNVKEEIPKTKEETETNDAEAATTLAAGVQDAHQDASPEDEPDAISPPSPEEEVIVSPIKKFFTTGIFSGLRKKKKLADDETTGKELVDTGKKEVIDMTEQSVQDQQLDEKESTGIKADEVEAEHKENELKEEILSATSDQISDEGKSSSTDPSTIIASEPHIMSPQEKDKVQASPLKRLLSGSNLKKPLKKPRSRRSSDAKLSDSGEHVSDQLLSSPESGENQKEEGPPQPPKEVAGESEGAWASFKKLLTPKKRMKQPSLTNEETQIPDRVEESKPSEGEQVSDHSTEEGKKRKDSSVSWEAVLCGSGRRRSRKTSDSEDETPQIDNKEQNQDGGSKHVAESPLESCYENENEIITSSPKQAGSPSEGEGASTWKSLKKLVTPKRRAKDVDESKDNIQSDSEVTQDESSFSIKKLLPGRKKRKSDEKQDQVSSDEAEKDIASDEDSETPAVIPLSEFDKVETEVNIEAQADIKSHIPEEGNHELEQDLPYQIAEPVLPCDSLHTEAKNIQDNDALEKQISPTPATNEESDDLTESVSKHQQLSDIPEEGAITETIATPASVTGEAARDDTIAEDLIEITSEAFTAPEPASDILLADETEMISAVSQLSSESSKTSGNTTPVLVENDIIDTDRLLHQVVKTVSDSPQAVPVCSEELSSERIVSSLSHQILESFVKEEQQMEIHKRLDAAAVNTGLNVDELAAPCQTESISEVNDSVSTEVVSELPTEEFDTAEMTPDEIQSNVTHPKESETELEKTKESLPFVECPSEINASLSTDLLTEGEEFVLDEGPLVEAHQAETETQKMDSKESDSTAAVADETKDGAMEHKVQTQTEKEDRLMYIITDQIQVEDKEQPSVKVEELQESAAIQATTLDPEEGSVQLLEKEVVSEDVPVAETVTYELKEDILPPTEVNVEPEEENELETGVAKTEPVLVQEVSEAVQAPTLDSEKSSVQSPEEEDKSEDISSAETVTDESKQTKDCLTDVSVESENKELPVDAVKTENVQQLEGIEAIPAPILDSKESSIQSPEDQDKPKDILAEETVTKESKQTEDNLVDISAEQEDKNLPVNAVDVEKLEEIKAVSALTLDSQEGSAQLPEEEVKPKDVSTEKTVTEEPQQTAQHLTEVSFEQEDKNLPGNAVKTEYVEKLEEIKAVSALTLDSEEGSAQTPEETVEPKDIIPQEPVTDEQKLTDHLTDFSVEEENKELPVNAVKSNNVQELEVTDTVPAPTLDSEEGSIKLPEREVISQDSPEAETVTDEPKEDTFLITEDNLDSVDAFETEHVQDLKELQSTQAATDPEADNFLLHEKKVTSEDITAVVTVTDKPEQENDLRVNMEEKQSLEAAQTEPVQEPEVLSSDVKDIVTETKSKEEASMHEPVVTESIEGVGAQEIGEHMSSEHIPKPDTTSVTASFTDESEVVAQLGKALEVTEDQKTESIPQDAQVEQKDYIPEVVDKVQTITAVHVSSVNEKAQNVQVIAKTVFSEETSALDEDNDGVTHELKTEMHLSAVQVLDEPDKEGAATEHAVVAQVVVCNFKDSSDPISDTLTEKTSEITEPLIEKMASEVVLMEESAAAAPLVEEDVTETADEGTVDVIMHVPLVAIEDNHRIQGQVVDVDIKSAETIVDSVLEVGITETKEVMDICQETVEKLDNLSATPETKEELMTKENQVTIQEVTQHVKENLPETVPESVIVNLNQEIHKQPDELTNVSTMTESELNNVENQKTMDDSNGPRKERQDEAPAVMSDDSPSDRQMTEDPMQACDIPGSSDVSSYDHKEDLEETKAEQEKSVEGVPAEEVKSSSNESDQTKIHEQAQDAQIAQSPIGTPSTTGLVVPQNTGVISSVGNVEPPSSLSLEFKLNIQFGQAKAPVPLPLATERTASTKQTEDVSEVKVQAAETIEPIKLINPTQEDEDQKQAELTEAAVQAEITEPAATRAMITAQPVLRDFGIQAETTEPAEQIKSTERVTSSVQPSESIHPIRPTEKREVFLSQPVLLKACVQETKSEEPEQKVEENDQDVWMDAEEVIYSQEETEVSIPKVEEPQEPLTESEQQEKAGPGHELMTETAPDSKTEEESQQEMHKTDKTCEIESDSEDFAVALEDLDTATMIVTTMEVE